MTIWGSFILWFFGDPVFVSANQRFRRFAICKMCVNYNKGRCKECGCFIRLKTKLTFSECPINKW